MGNQSVILLFGLLLLVALFSQEIVSTGNQLTENAVSTYAENSVKEINNAAVELGLRTLADSIKWRSTLSNVSLSGGTSTITYKDTLVGTDSAVVLRSDTRFAAGLDTSFARTQVVVTTSRGFIPSAVRGAFTAFGPLDDTISDMLIDGRNWLYNNASVSPISGVFAVSTGQPTFVNSQSAQMGGTSYAGSPAVDIAPTFPENPLVVETNSIWPSGWPTNPDAALGYPAGTLKNIALSGLVPGSQHVTKYSDLVFPLRGVTYIEIPNDSMWKDKSLGANPEGILVFHSPDGNAYWEKIHTTTGPFKGLMIMDKVFHIHMDILGAIIVLSPSTVVGQNCSGNSAHYVRYCESAITRATGQTESVDASWKSRLKVLSWYE